MNFSHAIFYGLDEGAGTTVSDSLGNGPVGTVAGTTTGIWANADCLTVNNAQGAGGDNYIKLQSDYIDAMCDLSTLADQSLVVMFWVKQPVTVASGTPFMLSYGKLLKTTPITGAWGIGCDNTFSFNYASNSGSGTIINRAAAPLPSLTAEWSNKWFAISMQIDVYAGKCVVSGCMDGRPQFGARIFDFEDNAFPSIDSLTTKVGLMLLAASANNGTGIGNVWGQTQIKRVFIGRTVGEQRNNIPRWANDFYLNNTGINSWMVA